MKTEKMITRTIHYTSCLALVIHDGEPAERFVDIPGKHDAESALKLVQKTGLEVEGDPIVYIYSAEQREQLYGIPVSLFMKYAKPLDPRKVAEDAEDAEDTEK